MRKIFVTGGCGFIGSNFIRLVLKKGYSVVNYDIMTYAGQGNNLADIKDDKYNFIKGDICNIDLVTRSMAGCDYVVNFAAESHVDKSIDNPNSFVNTNIIGTTALLEAAKINKILKFVQISTDEVYGSLRSDDTPRTEEDHLNPRSPYSASKASAEMMALSYYHTYGLPVYITRSSNNYGPYQFIEKLIPLFITNLIKEKKVPLMGKGENIRDWIYVDDNCQAILLVLEKGLIGQIYNIGGGNEKTNMEITELILKNFKRDKSWIQEIPHRLGHDFRYSLDSSKIRRLGWKPQSDFDDSLVKTIDWYKNNQKWWDK